MHKLVLLLLIIQSYHLISGFKLRGLDYTARVQATGCPDQAEVNQDISAIAAVADTVRIYSLVDCNQGALILRAIQELNLNLRVALGIWLDTFYDAEFPNEYAQLITLANTHGLDQVDYVIVGSETQYRGDFASDLLISYIQNISTTVKQQLGYSNIKITTADVVQNLIDEPQIIAAVDVVAYNQFSFWENYAIDGALADTQNWYNQIVGSAQGKPILISEVGWPADGPVQGNAVPGATNTNTFLQQFVCWATANNLNYFYFSAFDALWQSEDDQKYWGIFNTDGSLKNGISLDFSSCAGATSVPVTASPTGAPTSVVPTGPATTIPPTIQPMTGAPTEPATTAPATSQPSTASPTEPSTTTPSTSQPSTASPTEPSTTTPSTGQPTTVSPTEPATTTPPTGVPATVVPTEPVTSQPTTSSPTEPATAMPTTSSLTEPATTTPSTSQPTTGPIVIIQPTETEPQVTVRPTQIVTIAPTTTPTQKVTSTPSQTVTTTAPTQTVTTAPTQRVTATQTQTTRVTSSPTVTLAPTRSPGAQNGAASVVLSCTVAALALILVL